MTESSRRATKDKRAIVNGVALGLVVIMTAFAAFRSQEASNRTVDLQDQRDNEVSCISVILFSTVQALNERTTYSVSQSKANVALQRAQADFIKVILRPDHSLEDGRQALSDYFDALQHFQVLVTKNATKAAQFPYPVPSDFSQCLARARQ